MARRAWAWPLLAVLAVVAVYAANPTEANPVRPFVLLSYRLPSAAQYDKGLWDLAFVAFHVVLLTFTREFCMQELLSPLARACGIAPAKRARFAEQLYTALYILVLGPWGLYVMYRSPVWYFNTRGMYAGYPHRALDGGLKAYYLVQAAFWLQQVVVMVLGLEERRKDFREFVAHHIITVALIALSYRFHFTHMGIAVYITHDISDFFLAVSKSLNYLQFKHQGLPFALCISAWVYLRHYLNLVILYTTLPGGEFSTIGPYNLNWATEQYKSPIANVITFTLLALLQALNIFWLYCLLRSAYRLVFMGIAKDDRSEDEEPQLPRLDTAIDPVASGRHQEEAPSQRNVKNT